MIKEVTNLFLVKEDEVCLGMKKRGFGVGLWNGTGGKVLEGESVEEAAKREAQEEFGVKVSQLMDAGKTRFIFKDGLEISCHLFVCGEWENEPVESEEMAPKWFKIACLPLETMWETDRSWLPLILRNKRVEGIYYFNDDAKTVERYELKEIN